MRCASCRSEIDPAQPACANCGSPPPVESGMPVRPGGFAVVVPQGPQRRAAVPYLVWPVLGVGVLVFLLLVGTTGVTMATARGGGPAGPAAPSLPTDTAHSQTSSTALHQAAEVDGLLDDSAASRSRLTAPLQRLNTCRQVGSATPALRQVETERSEQLDRARDLAVDQLPGGDQMRDFLVDVFQLSLRADQDYQLWAAWLLRNGCGGSRSGLRAWDSATAADRRGRAKSDFVQRWNPIAREFGLPARKATEI